jgi:hypothetical protein
MAPPGRIERARKRGQRVAIVIFSIFVVGITGTFTSQIIRQVWFPTARNPGPSTCRDGVRGLIAAVRRAREAAAAETGGERAALSRFRERLAPEWDGRDGLGISCQGDPLGERALRDVDRLRYGEEHAIRYEAVDLADRRRTVQSLERELDRR